jgi:hypothetical protein
LLRHYIETAKSLLQEEIVWERCLFDGAPLKMVVEGEANRPRINQLMSETWESRCPAHGPLFRPPKLTSSIVASRLCDVAPIVGMLVDDEKC